MTAPADVLAVYDAAVEVEIKRISSVPYNSNEICRHFAGELRKRIASSVPDAGAVAELIAAATASLEQTKQNQRDGLVPTIYYPAHQRLASALALVGGAK